MAKRKHGIPQMGGVKRLKVQQDSYSQMWKNDIEQAWYMDVDYEVVVEPREKYDFNQLKFRLAEEYRIDPSSGLMQYIDDWKRKGRFLRKLFGLDQKMGLKDDLQKGECKEN